MIGCYLDIYYEVQGCTTTNPGVLLTLDKVNAGYHKRKVDGEDFHL